MSKKIIVSIFAFVLLGVTFSFKHLNLSDTTVKKIVIDAGHGGKDPGTIGSMSKEKDVALEVSLHLGRIIAENMPDVEVIYTRDKDYFIELVERASLANSNGADLFISIHCNADPKGSAYGTETWVMGVDKFDRNLDEVVVRENSVILMEDNYEEVYEGFDPKKPESYILFSLYQNAFINSSLKLAQKIENQFEKRVNRKSRGVKQAGFLVLWKTSMPSVLVELGFLSHSKEERYLNDELGQVYMASAIYRAVRDYKAEFDERN